MNSSGNVVGITSAVLDSAMAFKATGVVPQNVNYAVKSSFVLGFLEASPDANSRRLHARGGWLFGTGDIVNDVRRATALVIAY